MNKSNYSKYLDNNYHNQITNQHRIIVRRYQLIIFLEKEMDHKI
jgi:hypothetical protein